MAVLTPQNIDLLGIEDFTLQAAVAGGDTFQNPADKTSLLVVNNGGGAQITVTINSLKASSFGTDENITRTVEVGGRVFIGPFDRARFNALDGSVGVTYSSDTTVTVAVLHIHERGW